MEQQQQMARTVHVPSGVLLRSLGGDLPRLWPRPGTGGRNGQWRGRGRESLCLPEVSFMARGVLERERQAATKMACRGDTPKGSPRKTARSMFTNRSRLLP